HATFAAGVELPARGLQAAAELIDLRRAPAADRKAQPAAFVAQVVHRRATRRPGGGSGLQHRLEIRFAGLAGMQPQAVDFALHHRVGPEPDRVFVDLREGGLDALDDRAAFVGARAALLPGPP